MSKDYKIYFRHILDNSTGNVNTTEVTGSGEMPVSTSIPVDVNYSMKKRTPEEIESIFKDKYPMQYLQVRKKYDKKLKKLLKANENATDSK